MRWAVGVGAFLVSAIGLVLMFLLAQSTNNRALYEQQLRAALRHQRGGGRGAGAGAGAGSRSGCCERLRQGKFGSRLLIKLAAIFALVGVVPGVLVYVVSYQFVSRSIESWFDVKVEGALDAGPEPRPRHARFAVGRPGRPRRARPAPSWPKCRTPAPAWRSSASATSSAPPTSCCGPAAANWSPAPARRAFKLNPERPDAAAVAPGAQPTAPWRTSKAWTKPAAPGAGAAPPPACVRWPWCSGPASTSIPSRAFCRSRQPLPPAVVANALAVQEANREYQERALAREGLRRMYIGTLTLSLFLAVFGAVLLAVLFGNQLARPLLVLADGVRQVAAGDLRPTAVLQGKDELGGLTRSFAVMTQQLADARGAVEKTHGRARRRARQPADHPGQPDLRRDRARRAGRRCCRPTPARPACCARRWPPTRASRCPRCRGWTNSRRACSSSSTIRGRAQPARARPLAARLRTARRRGDRPVAATPSTSWRAARNCRARRGCWCSTTSPRSCRRSARRPGAKWRAGWRTKSRTR